MHLFIFAVIVFFFGNDTFSAQVISTRNATDIDIFPSTTTVGNESNKLDLNNKMEKQKPIKSLSKTAIQQDILRPVYDRSMDGGERKIKANSISIGSSGRVVLSIVIIGLIVLVFFFAMYVQQRNDSLPPAEDSKSQEAISEAKQELRGRVFVVKRYIRFFFETGLPCPQQYLGPSVSSDGVASVAPSKNAVAEKPTKVAALAGKTLKEGSQVKH